MFAASWICFSQASDGPALLPQLCTCFEIFSTIDARLAGVFAQETRHNKAARIGPD
jgi:hypothetical protein